MSRADCDVCDEKTTELYEQLAAKDAEIAYSREQIESYSSEADCLREQMGELAKWKQIAIRQRALIKFIETEERYAYSEHVILSDKELEQAATELEAT